MESHSLRIVSNRITMIGLFVSAPFLTRFQICHSWHPKLTVLHDIGEVDCTNVIMSNGRGHILGKSRCGLCGRKEGLKARCAEETCRARGEKRYPYVFHVTCARQAGFEVNHDDYITPCFYGTFTIALTPVLSLIGTLT